MTSKIYIAVARMHPFNAVGVASLDISNPSKFRRLKRFAEQSKVSGLVKKGKPGILVFDGEKDPIKFFLEHAKGLRYLDFHHLDTKPLAQGRIAGAKSGLQEVESTSDLVNHLESVGEKDWFRVQMGMTKVFVVVPKQLHLFYFETDVSGIGQRAFNQRSAMVLSSRIFGPCLNEPAPLFSMHLPGSNFITSSLIVDHNAFKNIIFRIATLTLDFLILRIFSLLAFRRSDYTSFLMFAEDIIQKVLFISSRGITARQSLLVGMFVLIATAGEFYDTMLWAIDNPGFVIKHRMVNGATLAAQMLPSPAYVVLITANRTNPSAQNTLESASRVGLYNTGLNFSLPGIFQEGVVEVAPPLYALNPINGTARIWLDDEGFAVGLDPTTMSTLNMTRSLATMCAALNDPDPESNAQVWNCNVPNSEALSMLQIKQGMVPIWWDSYHSDWLEPNDDNAWSSFGSGGGTMMMKQVFTVTKGVRRYTFKSTIIKASMSVAAPNTLDNAEITDFMRRTWSTNGTITTGVQDLINVVLQAKGNSTGRTFGEFIQTNISLAATSTDYLNVVDTTGVFQYSILRFILTNTTLIRSETLTQPPAPFEPCPGTVYRNTATGGQAISSTCNTPTINQTMPLNNNLFLGQLDTSAVGIFTGFLGDGTSNVSAVALTDTGINWITQEKDHMDDLLISRALLLGGNSSAVTVDVGYSVAAISGLQLLLSILPAFLAILAWVSTRSKALSYYQNSFLAAVLTTTHTFAAPCEELGHIRSMPEITIQRRGRHVTLRTPHEGTISNTVSIPVDGREMLYEPLALGKEIV